MSKIGNLPIKIPQGVEVTIEKKLVKTKGLKGELTVSIPKHITLEQKGDTLIVRREVESREAKSLHGLIRSLVNNAVVGVSEGFEKKLELSGVGFRANVQGDKLILSVGYSHPVEIIKPEEVDFQVSENKIKVSGADKQMVGDLASKIRKVKPAEPYKGKGIKYEGELIRRKPGKAQATGGSS